MAIPQSRRLDFSEIPVIDISTLVSGESDAATVEAIGSACRDVGFIYIKNHGVPITLIDNLLLAAEEFFSRSMNEKNSIAINERIRGYLPLRYRSYEGEAKAATSNQEGFWISEDRPLNPKNRLDGPNVWPENSEALRSAMQAYYAAATKLSLVLQGAFSSAIGESADYFEKLFTRQSSMLKLNHYPPQDNPRDVNNIGVVPHTDSGGFTILWQDHNGGLEIQSKSGEWVLAPPIPETFVINIGNTMQIWTNGEFSSTPHRVINRSGIDRYSIPFFANPRYDVPVKPLIGTTGETEETPGAGAGAGEYEEEIFELYQLRKWRRSFPIAGIPEL